MSIATLFYAELEKYSQSIGNRPVLLGVSGGVDSMVLMNLVHKAGISAVIAHVNYHMRPPDSDLDAQLVESEASKYGFNVHIANASPELLTSGNFQDNAREFRHAFFREVADKENCSAILLAHHREDQLETIMQKWFRGAGLQALSGMSVFDQGSTIFRPLLHVSKVDILKFATENNITFREDSSNKSNSYARNWLRNSFFEEIERFFPGWQQNVLENAERASSYDEISGVLVDKFADESGKEIHLSELQVLSQAAQRLLISTWLKKNGITFSTGQLDSIVRLIYSNTGSKVPIMEGVVVWRNRSNLQLKRTSIEPDFQFSTHFITDTQKESPQEDGRFVADDKNLESEFPQERSSTIGNQLTRSDEMLIRQNENTTIDTRRYSIEAKFISAEEECAFRGGNLYLCSESISFPLTVRRWEPGDRLIPFGMKGSMLVSDLLTNRKIASAQKKEAIVLVAFDARICAVIFPHPTERGDAGCIDNAYRLKSTHENRLELTINYSI
ncbi:MAG: tRNA lysidine(34) synthetase TilS [Balneolales bacterium]|nr:tRNA lysidine(34) synthetase TilS [Balneolales bacterium]